MNINRSEIKQYILNVEYENKENIIDVSYLNGVKKHITAKFSSNYIKNKVINSIDREIVNEAYVKDIKYTDADIEPIISYIESITKDKKHILYQHFEVAIKNNFITSWIGNVADGVLIVGAIIQNILDYIYILKLYKEDNKQNIVRKRDKSKILNAVDTLLKYTSNEQEKYYLNNMKIYEETISKVILLRCFYCGLSKIFIAHFNISN